MDNLTINADVTMAGEGGRALLANRYRVVKQLGQGGMGSVWLAEDAVLDDRKVAIKMLPPILVANKSAYGQLKNEALMAMKLSHSNIAAVRSFEENDGNPFIVQDYVEGWTLDNLLAENGGQMAEPDVVALLAPIASALDYAHEKGVVHRDVKPGNIIVDETGVPYILDFGIARESQETMTRMTGKLSSGTLLYMSPEQLRGSAPKAAQDVYSFAAMVYECLVGHPPFYRGQIECQIVNEPVPPLPEGCTLASSVLSGLDKQPENRPTTCLEVLVARDVADVDSVRAAGMSPRQSVDPPTRPVASPLRSEPSLREVSSPPMSWLKKMSVWLSAGGVVVAIVLAIGFGLRPKANQAVPEVGSSAPEEVKKLQANAVKTVTLRGGARMELVWCPPGEFLMGSPTTEDGRDDEETQHKVIITKGFWLGKYEVTQAQWQSVMGVNPSNFKGAELPVEMVSWDDCQLFLKKSGLNLRLPTEAEWEYACRAGTTNDYAGTIDAMAWFSNNSDIKTHPVGQKKPNDWGLHDMHGNVYEWCQDWICRYPNIPEVDPIGPSTGVRRVTRGGSWSHDAGECRSANRGRSRPGCRYDDLGLRVACSAEAFEENATLGADVVVPVKQPSIEVSDTTAAVTNVAPSLKQDAAPQSQKSCGCPAYTMHRAPEKCPCNGSPNCRCHEVSPASTEDDFASFFGAGLCKAAKQYEKAVLSQMSDMRAALAQRKVAREEAAAIAFRLADDSKMASYQRFLYMKGAFLLYVRDVRPKEALRTWQHIMFMLPDLDPRVIVETIELAVRGVPGYEDPILDRVIRRAREREPFAKSLEGYLTKPQTQLTEADRIAMAENAAVLGDWDLFFRAMASAGGKWKRLVDIEKGSTSAPTQLGETGDFWWERSESRDGLLRSALRLRAARCYVRALQRKGARTELTSARCEVMEIRVRMAYADAEAVSCNEEDEFLVVDLSRGPNAAYYPVRPVSIEKFPRDKAGRVKWSDDFKTRGLVLRLVRPGTLDLPHGAFHLTRPYYMGVFEVTQRQYELVMGKNPSWYSEDLCRPVDSVSYDLIRGSGVGHDWPLSSDVGEQSFLGRLRRRTGLAFDLPTEVQWEYVCRAGEKGEFGGDRSPNEMDVLGRHADNGGFEPTFCAGGRVRNLDRGSAKSGSYRPNAWGFYDMQGNVWECCLDRCPGEGCSWLIDGYEASIVSKECAVDPVGLVEGEMRMLRGGGWNESVKGCRVSARKRDWPSSGRNSYGFRLVCPQSSGGFARCHKSNAAIREDIRNSPRQARKGAKRRVAGEAKTLVLPGGAKLDLVWCPPGSFIMGGESDGSTKEGFDTKHKVTLTKGFWIGKYEVTQSQWRSVMGDAPSNVFGDDRPVDSVSWVECQRFLNKAGFGLRLPTEAEWEYACRAGSALGHDRSCRLDEEAWFSSNSEGTTHMVGQKKANAWGIHDMYGNVAEWCRDWLGAYSGDATNPTGADSGSVRVKRGGGYDNDDKGCRVSARTGNIPCWQAKNAGFRVCCSDEDISEL